MRSFTPIIDLMYAIGDLQPWRQRACTLHPNRFGISRPLLGERHRLLVFDEEIYLQHARDSIILLSVYGTFARLAHHFFRLMLKGAAQHPQGCKFAVASDLL